MKAHPSSTSSSEARGRRALRACGWAVLLVIAVDLGCRWLLPTGFLPLIERLTRARIAAQPAPDIEIIGDSVARSGFLAAGLSGNGLVARNSALPASGPVISYYLLHEALAAGRVPRALVIAHSPHNFSQFRYAVMMGSFAQWHELPDAMRVYGRWRDSAYAVMTRLSYLLMHRDSLQSALRDRDFSFFRTPDADTTLLSDRDELRNFRSEYAAGRFDRSRLTGPVDDFYRQPFTVLPINDFYFRRLLAMARAQGVRVYWFTMPTPAAIRDARVPVHYEQDLLGYLRQFEARGELTLLRANFVVYDDTMFRDWLHLNLKGAVQLACEMRSLRGRIVADLGARAAGRPPPVADADDPQAVLEQYCGPDGRVNPPVPPPRS